MAAESDIVLEADGLEVRYAADGADVLAVADVSFRLRRGECLGLVGESGCGKSSVAMAVMRHLGARGRISSGCIRFHGQDMAGLSPAALRAVRGKRIAMIYQDSQSALNPTLRIGAQLREVLAELPGAEAGAIAQRITEMLRAVGIADPDGVLGRYPHQLSGGQQQRVVIAMAFLAEPDLLILDEPTTALDLTIEAQVVELLARMRDAHRTTMLFISHNLGLVRRLSDRLAVMYAGQIIETGATGDVLDAPRHPYTQGLLGCIPRLDRGHADYRLESIPGQVPRLHDAPARCAFLERCRHARAGICDRPIPLRGEGDGRMLRCARWPDLDPMPDAPGAAAHASVPMGRDGAPVLVLDQVSRIYEVRRFLGLGKAIRVGANRSVSLTLGPGETLGVVGESGSGKSTLARLVMGLDLPSGGHITVLGDDVTGVVVERRSAGTVRGVQMVFQNPDSTLNPAHTVGFILGRAVSRLGSTAGRRQREAEIDRLLELVRLPREVKRMSAASLSGGQKQRVAVARAFAGRPRLVVADEPTSALDTSVKTAILELLLAAQRESDTALIFISHDLRVVRYMADRVGVMYAGRIIEMGSADALFAAPCHPYFAALLATLRHAEKAQAAPLPEDPAAGNGAGCAYAPRCPLAIAGVCDRLPPPSQAPAPGRVVFCHQPAAMLLALHAAGAGARAPAAAPAHGSGTQA
ncbi:MAG: dipeptide ABC transporter ATP-binding protein [Acetobacteraceae bacterium]|nr:dipeptide ABC transporter ATP-binding protein [Acetobacteraceae bacterium]